MGKTYMEKILILDYFKNRKQIMLYNYFYE